MPSRSLTPSFTVSVMVSSVTNPEDFEWLADLQKSQCYTTCDWANPAKSTDFGQDGFTASVTDWHELLQLTAPDKECGVVFVRGDFPNTPDAILARAQTREDSGSKGTFDIHFLAKPPPKETDVPASNTPDAAERTAATPSDDGEPDTSIQLEKEEFGGYKLGEKRAQGLANFRWPYMQYELRRKLGEVVRKGGYEGISFIKDGTMFQIIRLTAEVTPKREVVWPPQSINFRLGGKVQFGCPCSNGIDQSPTREYIFTNEGCRLVYKSEHYDHRLEIQVFVDGEERTIISDGDTGTINVDLFQTPTIIVTTYKLRATPKTKDKPEPYPLIPTVDAADIANYLGISEKSPEMTDKLWLASLTKQFDAVETLEICAVARYVEQILCVSSVPIISGNATTKSNVPGHSESSEFENISGTALVRNIMTSQYVELESVFWQVRFLVKAYNFLATRTFESSILGELEKTYLKEMRKVYLSRIQSCIQMSLLWMAKAEVKREKILLPIAPERASTGAMMNQHSGRERVVAIDSSYNQACFTRIAIWYTIRNGKKWLTPEFYSFILLHGIENENLPQAAGGNGSSGLEKESTPKNDVLSWYDMSCLLLLWQELYPEAESLELEQIHDAQEYREKIAKRLRKKQSGPYSMEDEELDRLFLLGDELGLQNRSDTSATLVKARVEETRTKISDRKPTKIFNCGPQAENVRRSPRLISNAPWELALLNHHTLLQTTLYTAEDQSQSQSRDACFQFFLSDYTFMVSWDRADKSMIAKWWDIEPGAIVCSTLIDKIQQAKSNSSPSSRPTEDLSRSLQLGQPSLAGAQTARRVEELIAQFESRQESYQVGDRLFSRDFDWRRCRPNRIYHLKSWVQSLDNTPEIFYSKHASFPPQRIIKYLMDGGDPKMYKHPTYSKNTVREKIAPDDLPFVSTWDFHLEDAFTFKCSSFVLQDDKKNLHHEKLLNSLNDCLVDRDTTYRILFAEKCCPEVVRAFAYVWHPDALDTFDNYFSTASHFLDARDTIWTSTITISHWKLLRDDQPIDKSDRFHESEVGAGRKDGEFPPKTVSTLWKMLEERSSSLVITGDSDGYNWICSIWSSLTNSSSIKGDIDRLPQIMHLFIHKQATGRCLAFLIILGHICGKLAEEYNEIVQYLDRVVELGEEALFKGLEWEPDTSIDKLKRMIWGGQALRIFDDRLSASLSQIRNAKEALDNNIKQDEGQQHITLVREYMSILEGFDKHFSALSNVQVRIQLKIQHVIGLRDGISTVTNVEDSRTALGDSSTNITLSKTTIKQGNNIRVLTLLTIVYLPLGYVTGLFSENHGILPGSAGKDLYAGLVVLFTIVTYGLAWRLDSVIEFLKAKGTGQPQSNGEEPGSTDSYGSNPEESGEAMNSRGTANGSSEVTKQNSIPDTNQQGWRRAWGKRNGQVISDEETLRIR